MEKFDKVSINYFHTSTPQRSVELRMKKESREFVARAGHFLQKGVESFNSFSFLLD